MKRSKKLSVKAVREEEVKLRGGDWFVNSYITAVRVPYATRNIQRVFNQLYEAVTVK